MTWPNNGRQIGEIRVRFVVQNIGTTPALTIQMSAALRQVADPTIARRDVAALLQRIRKAHPWTDSVTLFPRDTIDTPYICSIPDADMVIDPRDGTRRDTTTKDWYKNIIMLPVLVICVDYKLAFAEQYYQTWEVYTIRRRTAGKVSGAIAVIIPADGDIPIEELEIVRQPFGGTFTN